MSWTHRPSRTHITPSHRFTFAAHYKTPQQQPGSVYCPDLSQRAFVIEPPTQVAENCDGCYSGGTNFRTVAPPSAKAIVAPTGVRLVLLSNEAVLAVGAIFICLLLDLAFVRFGIDVVDEGYFADQAARVLHGQVPYRDFDTLYTPALLYLNAGLFAIVGGPHIVALRLLAVAGRAALAFGLYMLGRPLTRPLWAAVPALFVLLGLDLLPVYWWPHPGWLSAALTLITIRTFARLPTLRPHERVRWLLLVGGLTAVVFAFKQNAGVFLGLAAAVFLLLHGVDLESRVVSPSLRMLQTLGVAGVLTALLLLMRPHLDVVLAAYLVAPVAGVCLLEFMVRVRRGGEPISTRLALLIALAAGFVCLTLPWVLAVVLSLDGRFDRLAGFVGVVEQGGLFESYSLPSARHAALLLSFGLVSVAAVRIGRHGRWSPIIAASLVALALLFVRVAVPDQPLVRALIETVWRLDWGFPMLLPSAAIWAGLWLARGTHFLGVSKWQFRWYLTAGAFTFLTEYPITDLQHLAWSAGVLLVVGCLVLERLHRSLSERWQLTSPGRVALVAALLLVPTLAALPIAVHWRFGSILGRDVGTGLPRITDLVTLDGMGAANGLLVSPAQGQELTSLIDAVREMSAPGESIFVYPTSPLIYVLADRPNPTRFEHLYPHTIPMAELSRMVQGLEQARVQIVVVSTYSLLAEQSTAGNEIVEKYLATHFQESWRTAQYQILQRVPGP
jgi:hypothetical protein